MLFILYIISLNLFPLFITLGGEMILRVSIYCSQSVFAISAISTRQALVKAHLQHALSLFTSARQEQISHLISVQAQTGVSRIFMTKEHLNTATKKQCLECYKQSERLIDETNLSE